jgi:amino-acid N-acetyltransferase
MDLHPVQIEDALELQALRSFLERNKLPYKDIVSQDNLFLLYYDSAGDVLGSGGLEIYGDAALLRSVAVRESERGKQVGKQIVKDVLKRALEQKIQSIFLLTETAHDFFLKEGFSDISRDEVPANIKASTEFSFVCPASAKCMVYAFRNE